MKVLGLMTGTSMDGIDYCYVDIKMSKKFTLFNHYATFKKILKGV